MPGKIDRVSVTSSFFITEPAKPARIALIGGAEINEEPAFTTVEVNDGNIRLGKRPVNLSPGTAIIEFHTDGFCCVILGHKFNQRLGNHPRRRPGEGFAFFSGFQKFAKVGKHALLQRKLFC